MLAAESQSHPTDQGFSDVSSRGWRRSLLICRNPTIQIRAFPTPPRARTDVGHGPVPCSRSQSHSTDQVSSHDNSGRNLAIIIVSQSHSTDQVSSHECTGASDLNWYKVAIPPYRSGLFRRSLLPGRTTDVSRRVAIPPYRSGLFRHVRQSTNKPGGLVVAIPPYRSGLFRGQNDDGGYCRWPEKSQSHQTDQGFSDRSSSAR
jgi:hypothetical protein